ncbi:MAG: hypothetical protein NXI15_02515 [Gammaproteobacteria bacterium]|nr:hypothetical protein [Gammaproteobacteria bacterium]
MEGSYSARRRLHHPIQSDRDDARNSQQSDKHILPRITVEALDHHVRPVEAAESARDAGVGKVLHYRTVT